MYPNLTLASCDPDLWPPDPTSWTFHPLGPLVSVCSKISPFSKILYAQVWQRTYKQTNRLVKNITSLASLTWCRHKNLTFTNSLTMTLHWDPMHIHVAQRDIQHTLLLSFCKTVFFIVYFNEADTNTHTYKPYRNTKCLLEVAFLASRSPSMSWRPSSVNTSSIRSGGQQTPQWRLIEQWLTSI